MTDHERIDHRLMVGEKKGVFLLTYVLCSKRDGPVQDVEENPTDQHREIRDTITGERPFLFLVILT